MKKLMIVGMALLMAAFTAEASADVFKVKLKNKDEKKQEGRTLYQYLDVSEEVRSFVDTYIHESLDQNLEYRMLGMDYLEEDSTLQYKFELYDTEADEDEAAFYLEVIALPTNGVQEVVLTRPQI